MEKKKNYRQVLPGTELVNDDALSPYVAFSRASQAMRDCGYCSYYLEFEILNWLEKMAIAKGALDLEAEAVIL